MDNDDLALLHINRIFYSDEFAVDEKCSIRYNNADKILSLPLFELRASTCVYCESKVLLDIQDR